MRPDAYQRETAKYWTDGALGGLELLSASYVTHAFAPHTHEGFAIGVVEAGAETFHYRGQLHIAPAGSIILINPGELHTGEALNPSGWRYRMLYPDAALLQRAASEAAGRQVGVPFFPQPVVHDASVAALLVQMHSAIERVESPLERESRLIWTLSHLVTRYADARPAASAAPRAAGLAARARAYLLDNLSENITLEALAREVNVSPFHLLRVFRAAIGLPPHSYQIQARVSRAKALLRHGLPIADAATEVGFTDQSHLTRHFKRIVGVTPGAYSKNLQDARWHKR